MSTATARRETLADLLRLPALGDGDVESALARLTEAAASLLGVERASVWSFDQTKTKIACADLFERGAARHTRGSEIVNTQAPRYFGTLATERAIAAHDARHDARTSELAEDYLVPNGITSMLDAPVFVGGEMVGVVCNEHVGAARTWDLWEELVAGTIADHVALVLATAQRVAAERKADDYRKQLEQLVAQRTAQLEESEAGLGRLFEASPVALVLTRIDTQTVLRTNQRAIDLFGVDATSARGRDVLDFWVEPADRRKLVDAVHANGSVQELQARLKSASGREFWAELDAKTLVFEGTPALLVGIHDRTRQREVEAQLRELATHDSLTGVFNRRHFFDVAERELARAERYAHPLSLAMVDLDHFKHINDAYGHATGDHVLRLFADACRNELREIDVIARHGGEEFVVLFIETPQTVAISVCERVRRAVELLAFSTPDGTEGRFTISIGVVERHDGESLVAMLRRADENMYAAKDAGRNRLHGAFRDARVHGG
jgi:diguanylate cyclase (GGDEF)-like protein/PAS domain S-box-containing protein